MPDESPKATSVKKPSRYTVTERRLTTPNVFVLSLAPVTPGNVLEFLPGQFVMLRLLNPDGSVNHHKPYSIASSPLDRGRIELGIKIAGEFTHLAAALKAGDVVEIQGPYGRFTLDESMPSVVFFAGGIGITPFMSMMRYATAKKLATDITLLYANQTRDDIAYLKEITSLAKENPRLKLFFTVERGDPPETQHDTAAGRIGPEHVKKYCGEFFGKRYYLCGPQPFMDAQIRCLKEYGVTDDQILIEKF